MLYKKVILTNKSHHIIKLCLLITLIFSFYLTCLGNEITYKNGWFYVDSERFFVKGVCFFENHTVDGKFTRLPLNIIDSEFKLIKEAGFNTIRSQLNSEELKLAEKHGLMVMQGANHLFFSEEYKNPKFIEEQKTTTKKIMQYSKEHDNILFYIIDNEPNVKAIYRQGEKAITGFYNSLINTVKNVQTNAVVSMASMPPVSFLDHTIFDCLSLNLYPYYPASFDCVSYSEYAEWFKNKYADGKPFIISEYGWDVTRGEHGFSENMIRLLNEQIKSGATGSFLFTWRTFGTEGKDDNNWFGIVPNNGGWDSYKAKPRNIYYDLKNYFQAIIIEPKKEEVYYKELPVEVYGTDKTGSISISFNKKIYSLKKKGKYWWTVKIPLSSAEKGKKILAVTSKDKKGKILVKKEVPFYILPEKKSLSVKITRQFRELNETDTYKAKIRVTDHNGNPIPNCIIKLGVNQTEVDVWTCKVFTGKTDKNGEYFFRYNRVKQGYFTLMAGIHGSDPGIKTYCDVDIVRIN
ncbi:MAG: hypothetical protein JW983_05300 [Elusimicrobia bacterium]|nr:hypothetical protein [Elusimicrobiota bacterium]